MTSKNVFAALFVLFTFNFSIAKGPHNTGLISSLNLGVRYSSLLQNRGIILYKDFQIDPVVGVFFLDDKLEYLGDSIGYRDFIYSDKIRLRSRFVSITDKPLFPAHEALKNSSPSRKDTYEWANQLEFFLPGYNENYFSEIDISYAKDLVAHKGQYVELQSKTKLFDFVIPKMDTKIEPNIYFSVGWGDDRHNRYLYGPTADVSEFNNLSYGFWFAFPDEADRFYPIVQIKHFEVLGQSKDAEYAKNSNSGYLISFIATYGILPF
ncbi:hypothetical protein CIK05_06165 [Bdellovibrio sp. qaytius]|nr:hypothetical protein CIK05_06165 [Bdellovibrio sp. qaytius]